MSNTIEIEVDSVTNSNLFFAPAQEKIRGRLDFQRMREKEAFDMAQEFPQGVPGQRIGFNLDSGEGYISEPLQEPQHASIKAKLEKKFSVPPARRALTGHAAHAPTMLHWMKRAVDSGLARLVQGQFPSKLEGRPVLDFHRTSIPSEKDKQTRMMLAYFRQKLSPKDREEMDDFMASFDE